LAVLLEKEICYGDENFVGHCFVRYGSLLLLYYRSNCFSLANGTSKIDVDNYIENLQSKIVSINSKLCFIMRSLFLENFLLARISTPPFIDILPIYDMRDIHYIHLLPLQKIT